MTVSYKLKHLSRRALQGAVVSAILLSAYGAQAQCPEVSLERCQAPGYLESHCGPEQIDACSQLVSDALAATYDATPNEHLTVLPDSLGGGQEVSRFVPYSFSDHQISGGLGIYEGVVNRSHLIAAKDASDFTPDDQDFSAMKQSWTQDGITLNSCEEFVYKKFYDYSVFEDRWGGFVFADGERGSNYRAFFQAAFARDGIVGRTLSSIDGDPISLRLGDNPTPKNAYYTFQVGPYPTGYPQYPFDRALIGQVDPRGRSFYRTSPGWHQQMSDRLSSFLDEELQLRAAEQKIFGRLVQSRTDLWQSYQAQRRRILSEHGDPTPLDRQTATELFEIDHNLEDGLRNASRHGCLTLDQPTACDWSPQLFKEQLDAVLLPLRESNFQRCLFWTMNDFGPESYVRHAERLRIPRLEGDYTTSPRALGNFLDVVDSFLIIDEITRDRMRGWSKSDANGIGNDWFGVRYNYSMAAGLSDFWGPGSRVCDANAYINGSLNLDATVVKQNVEVVRASADARTRQSDVRVTANLRVVGFDVYDLDQTYPLNFNVNLNPKRSGDLLHVSYFFVVAGVPVTVGGGISGTVGLDFNISGGVNRNCGAERVDLVATGLIKPSAELEANASAAVGVRLVSVGIRGTLVLADLALPLNENVQIFLANPSDPGSLTLRRASALDLSIDALSGKLTLFVKIPFKTFERKLIDWSGYHSNVHLYNYSFEIPLVRLR